MSTNIRTVHYLGSKVRMLDSIKEYIDELNINNGRICDLFCGSAVVSEFLLQYYDVIAVDIQNYSKIYCEARLSDEEINIDSNELVACIKNEKSRIINISDFEPIIQYESECIEALINGECDALYEIIEKGSLYSYLNDLPYSEEKLSNDLETVFAKVKSNLKDKANSSDSTITRYYGGLYFSFKQAIDIDSIATFAFTQDEALKNKILAALMGATTDVVNTVGKQFAQPLKVRKNDGTLKYNLSKKIITDRNIDVFEQFKNWMEYYLDRPKSNHHFNAICDDYENVLKNLKPGDVEVIYADPPYTRYHYSRYYHILETICLHDTPAISTTFPNGKGGISRAIYRNDRHQSPFCIKSKAPKAFDTLFKYAHKAQASIVLSYSPFDSSSGATPRLLSINEIVEIASRYYQNVYVESPGQFMHSRFNKLDNNYEINYNAEKLIICRK